MKSETRQNAHQLCQRASLRFADSSASLDWVRESQSDGGNTPPQRGTQSMGLPQLWIQTPCHGLLSSALPREVENGAFLLIRQELGLGKHLSVALTQRHNLQWGCPEPTPGLALHLGRGVFGGFLADLCAPFPAVLPLAPITMGLAW